MDTSAPDDARYLLLDRLGRGSWGDVHRALDRRLIRLVALKELQGAVALTSPWTRLALEREVRILSYLDHPGIPSLYDEVGDGRPTPGFTMRLVRGRTLQEHVAFDEGRLSCAPLSVFESVRILKRLAETLAHAHDRGILHLDLKPANVMVGPYGEVLLLDWGNASLFDPAPYRAALGEHAHERDLAVLMREPEHRLSGTVLFMSPEQIGGERAALRPTSDVFAAGALFYLLLIGRPPFVGCSLPETLLAIQQQELPDLDRLRRGIPPRLAQIVARMLAKDPAERYPSFHDVRRDLEDYLSAGQGLELISLVEGEVLFREGEAGDVAYSVVSGRVRVERQSPEGPRHLGDVGPGEIVGELAILTSLPRSATVSALAPTELRVLPRARVDDEIQKLEPWMGAMVTTLARRFLHLLGADDTAP
ncbi:MAG: cyclic nucleotide-binding domain-containing protein [Planctomycetota bacterium]